MACFERLEQAMLFARLWNSISAHDWKFDRESILLFLVSSFT